SAGEFQGTRRDRCVWNQSAEEIWWARLVTIELRSCRSFAWKLGRERGRTRLRASINRRCAAIAIVWHRRAKAKISAPSCRRRNLCVRADRSPRGLRPRDVESKG